MASATRALISHDYSTSHIRAFGHLTRKFAMPDDQVASSDAPTDPKPIIRLKESVINKIAAGEVLLPPMDAIPAQNSVPDVDHSQTLLRPEGTHRE